MSASSRRHSTRITSITKEDVNAHFKTPIIELELTHDVATDDLQFRLNDNNQLVAGYLSDDPHPIWSDWGYDEGNDEFKEFTTSHGHHAFMAKQREKGRVCFIVDKYENGQVHYSVAGTLGSPDPDMQWDLASNGVFVPCEANQERFRNKEITEAQLIEGANQALQTYSSFCNGDTYGMCTDIFEKQHDGRFEKVADEACWSLVGSGHARACLDHDYLSNFKEVPRYEPTRTSDADDTLTR